MNIYLPIKAREICTVKNSRRILVLVVLFFALLNLMCFWTLEHDPESNTCASISPKAKYLYSIFRYIDATFYSYLPISMMIFSNTAIVVKLVLSKKHESNSTLSKASNSITIMLIGTCVMFITFTLPYAVYYSVNLNMSSYLYAAFVLMMYSNHTFNFVVYILSNRQFRKELLRLFVGRKRAQVAPLSVTGSSTAPQN